MNGIGNIGQTVPPRTIGGEPPPEGAPRQVGQDGAPPPAPQALPTVPEGVPVLAPPLMQFDALSSLADEFLALKLKIDQELINSEVGDVRDKGVRMKEKNEEIGRKLGEAANKLAEAKKTQETMKVLSWVAVGLSVLAAVATGGVFAIVAAGIGVAMAVLNETGVMNKLTDAIAEDRMKNLGESPSEAKKTAMYIMTGITIAISVATIVTGLVPGAQLATVGVKVGAAMQGALARAAGVGIESVLRANSIAVTGVKIAAAATTAVQAGAGVYGGVQRYEAATKEAETVETRAFLRRLQQQMEEEQEEIAALVQQMQSQISTVVNIMAEQAETSTKVIGQMRPQTA
jgi:transloator